LSLIFSALFVRELAHRVKGMDYRAAGAAAFCMPPLPANLKLKARDVVGYGVLQLAVHAPVVFFLCWMFARYIPYVPPIK